LYYITQYRNKTEGYPQVLLDAYNGYVWCYPQIRKTRTREGV